MEIQLSFTELRKKDVVNMVDGRRLGRIIDIVFDIKGRIIGLVTPGFRRMLFLKSTDDIFVPWCDIKKIGDDVILVELKPQRVSPKEKCYDADKDNDVCCQCGHCHAPDGYCAADVGVSRPDTAYGRPSGANGQSMYTTAKDGPKDGFYYSSAREQKHPYGNGRSDNKQSPKYYYNNSGAMYD